MKNNNKTREQLLNELEKSNRRIAELEKSKVEHKQVEEEIHNRDREYKTLINNLPGFVYRCLNDENWTMSYISSGCKELTGYPQEDFINNKNIAFNDIIDTGYQQKLWDMWQNVLKEKTTFEYEYPIITKSGQIRWVWERGCGIYSDDGKLQFLEGFITDITKHKQSEEDIMKLSTAVKQSPSVIAITDIKGNLEYVNPKFCEITGYSSQEVIGQNPKILKSDELPDKIYKEFWDTISSGKEWRGEFHNKKKNGEFFWEAASISPIFDKQGKIINYLKVAEDITERKMVEEDLKKNEQFLNSILESVQDGVSVLSPDLTVLHVNGIMNKWYKENLPLEGKKCYEVYHNANKPCIACPTLRCLESGSTEWNIVAGLPGSPVKWIELFSYPIKDPDSDKVTGVVEFVRDITERKKAELELAKHREHLEELVQERTKELDEKNKELKHFNSVFVDREFRIKELKDRVKELEGKK